MIEGRRQSVSCIASIGTNYAGTWTGIKGSICNGFSSTPQFAIEHPETLFDSPTYFTDEDWIVHTGGWLSGLSEMEKPMTLQILTTMRGVGVSASIMVALPETTSYVTDAQGNLTITGLPVRRQGSVFATLNGRMIFAPLTTISGDAKKIRLDFSDHLIMGLDVNMNTLTGSISISNTGQDEAEVQVSLAAVGAVLSSETFAATISSGGASELPFFFTADFSEGVRPVFIRAAAKSRFSSAQAEFLGRIPVEEKVSRLPNYSFETGDLTGWNVINGTAFSDASIVNLNTAVGGTNEIFNKQGEYLLWGYTATDDAVGELRSEIFTLAARESRVKVGGGANSDSLYVALVDAQTGQEYFRNTGRNSEKMTWMVWDTTQYAGRQCYVKILDHATGGWAHVNADAVAVPVYRRGFDTNFLRPSAAGSNILWQESDAGLSGSGLQGSYITADSYRNLILKTDLVLQTAQTAGLIFRGGDNPFADGAYYAYLDIAQQLVCLASTNPRELIVSASRPITASAVHQLAVQTKNNTIRIYFDRETEPCIVVEDARYSQGKAGVGMEGDTETATALFNHSTISPTTGFETNLPELIKVGNYEEWMEQQEGLVGWGMDGAYVTTNIYTDFILQAGYTPGYRTSRRPGNPQRPKPV